jgi:5-formyltetrahydrofolate cyclo-ligase
VPGLAFDESGHRLGYGKGFYDKWLKKFRKEKRVGACFDFQAVKRLPKTETDTPVGLIITDKRVIRAGQQSKK